MSDRRTPAPRRRAWLFLLVPAVGSALLGNAWLADGSWMAVTNLSLQPEDAPWAPLAGLLLSYGGAFVLLACLAFSERERAAGGLAVLGALPGHLAGAAQEFDGRCQAAGVLRRGEAWAATSSALALGLASSWLADGVLGGDPVQGLVGLVLLPFSAWWAYEKVPGALPIHARLDRAPVDDARALIIPMSRFAIVEAPDDSGRLGIDELEQWSWAEATRHVDEQPTRAHGRSNLRPLIRAVNHHAGRLEQLVLVRPRVEPGGEGVQERVEHWLARALRRALPDCRVELRGPVAGTEFMSVYREVNDAVEDVHAHARQAGRPLLADEILVDITGGLTPTSVAAAAGSLHNDVRFQYVDTNLLGRARPDSSADPALRGYDLTLK